jgi:hypothetical protein
MIALLGCSRTIQWPHLRSPGSATDQRAYAANLVDPYAAPEAGPNIEDTRPRDFNRPYSEPKRVQQNPIPSIKRHPRFPGQYIPPTVEQPPAAWGAPAAAGPSVIGP